MTTNGGMIFDNEEIVVAQGGGLDIPNGSYPCILWGIVTYQDFSYDDDDKLVSKKLLVVQFPTQTDESGIPKVGWAYANDSFGPKSNLHKHLKEMLGRSIESQDPIRLPNGNLDPKKLYGILSLCSIGNVSKTDGSPKQGIINFMVYPSGMPQYEINPNAAMPQYIIDLKEGKHLKGKQEEAPVVPQGAKQGKKKASPPMPQIPVQAVAAPVAVVQPATPAVAPVQPTSSPAPFKPTYTGKHCGECGEPQFTRDPAKGGGVTCKNKHLNAEAREDLLNFEDAPPTEADDESPDNVM